MMASNICTAENCFGLLKYEHPVTLKVSENAKSTRDFDLGCQGDTGENVSFRLQDILKSVAPPREWDSGGQRYIQTLSQESATRQDDIKFQLHLHHILNERQARSTGLDPVRREIFTCAFDEMIRRVAVDSSARGLLLLRLRDEIRMTLRAYHLLYESAVDYGCQCADDGYKLKVTLLAQVDSVEDETEKIRERVAHLAEEVDHTRRKLKEKRETEAKRFAEQIQFMKRANQQIRQETEALADYHAPE